MQSQTCPYAGNKLSLNALAIVHGRRPSVPPDAENPNHPLIDPEALSRAAAGMGSVVVLPNVFTWMLTEKFGKTRSVFGGAVRAYLRGFTEDANPYAHQLVIADHVSTPDGGTQCVRWMRSLAATESLRQFTLGRDVLTFAEVRNASLRYTQQRLKLQGASAGEQLDAANARIEALERQFIDQAAELDYLSYRQFLVTAEPVRRRRLRVDGRLAWR